MEVDVAQLDVPNAANSGPNSFRDFAALRGDDVRTDHIPGCLDLWEDACRKRGVTTKKAKAAVLEIFMQADEGKVSSCI